MARISIIVTSLRSSLFRTLSLATDLHDAGHDVVMICPPDVEQIIAQNGLEARVMPEPWVNPFTSPLARPALRDRLSLSKHRARAAEAAARYQVDTLPDILRATAPDLVIINAELHAHIIVARGMGLKVALVASMFVTAPSLSAPPLHVPAIPGRGFGGSCYGVGLAWLGYFLRKRLLFARNWLRDWGGDCPSALAHLARQNGVGLRRIRRVNSWPMPWAYRLPTLLMLPKALDLPKKHWANFHFVGGSTMLRGKDQHPDLSAFEAFTGDKPDAQHKRIIITFGSMLRPDWDIVKVLVETIRIQPDWQALFLVSKPFWDVVPDPPQNLTLVDWAPLPALMPHADVIVTHGGNATLLEAIDAKLPILTYPFNNDQFGGAARVAFHNLGLVGHPKDDAATVVRHIETLTTEPGIQDALADMQTACRFETSTHAIRHLVEGLLVDGGTPA